LTGAHVNGASENAESLEPPYADDASSGSAGIAIAPVLPQGLGDVWPKVKRMVHESVRWSPFTRRLATINDVERGLYEGDYTLWIVFRDGAVIGAVLTSFTCEPQCKVLDISYGAGEDVKEWAHDLYELMDDLAIEHDCRFIRIEGRAGWGDVLGDLGFKEAYRAFMIEV